jgi:hypothetical protein
MRTQSNASPIIGFYRGTAPDGRGRLLEDILTADDEWLERTHDYIQWLFPLRDRSAFNVHAPTLDDATIAAFRADDALRNNLRRAFERMLAFYGFETQDASGALMVVPASNAAGQQRNWLTPGNHNFLRITRILTSLRLLGLPEQAQALLGALSMLYVSKNMIIGITTYRYWCDALEE